jgi:hypothetical protein
MEPIKAILYMYPDASLSDFEVIRYPNNTWEITKWNINSNIPTGEELEKAYDEYVQNISPLTDLKKAKINELDLACKNAILTNFTATLNNIDYAFAYDMAAQSRFNGVGILFLNSLITQVDWTAYQKGNRVRITLTKEDFNIVSLAALAHQNDNITKYSDLYVKVMNATTADEIAKITW